MPWPPVRVTVTALSHCIAVMGCHLPLPLDSELLEGRDLALLIFFIPRAEQSAWHTTGAQ